MKDKNTGIVTCNDCGEILGNYLTETDIKKRNSLISRKFCAECGEKHRQKYQTDKSCKPCEASH